MAPTRIIALGPGVEAARRRQRHRERLALVPAVLGFLPLGWLILAGGSFGLAIAFGPFPRVLAEVASALFYGGWFALVAGPLLAIATFGVAQGWRSGASPKPAGQGLVRFGVISAIITLLLATAAWAGVILFVGASN